MAWPPSQILGAVRSTARRALSGLAPQAIDVNAGGDMLCAQALPERTELVRMGFSFAAQIPLTSAWTLLITVPTTLANLSLQNGEAINGGKSYIIDRFWIKNTTTTASAGFITPLAQLVVPGTTQVDNDATVLRWSLSGKAATNALDPKPWTRSKLVMNSILTGCLGDQWMHFNSLSQVPTTNLGAVIEVPCYGRYIVPPQGSFNVNAQESVSGGVAIAGIEWHECFLDLG